MPARWCWRPVDTPGILASDLHADGKHVGILCVPGHVSGGQVLGDPLLKMDGQAVFKLAVGVLEDTARAVLAKAGKTEADIDWLIPHQANIRIMQSTAKKLKLPMDKVIVTVDQHGNTSAASIPLALDSAVRSGKIKKGETLHARRRRRRLHLGRGAARFLGSASPASLRCIEHRTMKPFAFVFPGQGSQSVGMLDAWGDHPVVRRDAAGSLRGPGRGHWPADPRRPQGSAGADDQYPARDAGGRCGGLSGLDGRRRRRRRRSWRAIRWASTRRWWPPAC